MAFVKFNINPKGRKTSDCVTRAIAHAAEVPWGYVADVQYNIMKATAYAFTSTEVINKTLERLGFQEVKYQPEKGGKRATVAELAEQMDRPDIESVVIKVSGHLTCAIGGDWFDTWDCGDKAVYKYWIKRREARP